MSDFKPSASVYERSCLTAKDVRDLEIGTLEQEQEIVDDAIMSGVYQSDTVLSTADEYIEMIGLMLENDPITLPGAVEELNLLLDDVCETGSNGNKLPEEVDGSMLAIQALTESTRS